MSSRISVLFLCFSLLCFGANAQGVIVHGRFLTDSAKIGERIPYSLSVRYPASQSVLFPDSTFSFAPFDAERKVYFPTETKNQISRDSAIYLLSTFEIDSLQSLALPVFVIHEGDCTAVYSASDTVFVKQLVKSVPPSIALKDLPLRSNADYMRVSWLLNYPLLLLILGILLIVLVIVWIIFGKRIRRYLRIKRLMRNHLAFLERFSRHVKELQQKGSAAGAEAALVEWKKYMESLLSLPYTKLTSKEILRSINDETLKSALQNIDRMVYARDSALSVEAFDRLRLFTQDQFARKTEEVKHG